MSDTDEQPHITIDHAGRAVATADLESSADTDTISASMHVESGHLPTGTRTQLVDAVVDRVGFQKSCGAARAVTRRGGIR